MHLTAFEQALQRVANRRIEEAMEQGEFRDLAGEGRPLDLGPYDENWWVRKWAKRQHVSEPQLQRELREVKAECRQQKGEAKQG